MSNKFPDGFLWGASTASHQVEGNQQNNWSPDWEQTVAGKLASEARSRLKGSVPDYDSIAVEAENPDNYISGRATDHLNRYETDLDIAKQLNFNALRISVEWSRIEPSPGQFDQSALEHYQAVVEAMFVRGIEPVIVLHHFTNPVWFDEIGWHDQRAPELFARYANEVQTALSGVKYWLTINEPNSYYFMRYLNGTIWPEWPRKSLGPINAFRAASNFRRAHISARSRIKSENPDAQVSTAHGWVDVVATNKASKLIARIIDYFANTINTAKLDGYLDFLGVNHYSQMTVDISLSNSPLKWVDVYGSDKLIGDMGWAWPPESIYNVLMRLKDKQLPIIIVENGMPDYDDSRRAQFIRRALTAVKSAIDDGADVRGYLHWSLLDNYEWSEGWWPKFGLVSVNRKSGNYERTIKDSARYYARIAAANKVLPLED